MSNVLPPLEIPSSGRNTRKSASNISLPPLSSWSDGYRAFDGFESSPPCSSSPPMTPFSSGSSHSHAFFYSSPRITPGINHHSNDDSLSDHPGIWDQSYLYRQVAQATTIHHTLFGSKSLYPSDSSLRSSSPLLAPERSDDSESKFTRAPSSVTRDVVSRFSSTFTDSEEDENDDDDGINLGGQDVRATFFHTSAERGQWRDDPVALKLQSRLKMRKSAPTWSPPPISGMQLLTRPISEPAHSTSRQSSPADIPDSHDRYDMASELRLTSSEDTTPSDHSNPITSDPPCSSYAVGIDSEPTEVHERHCLSSPLPPSSPPLSPISLPASPMVRSLSPLSFASSPPFVAPSSPLSFLSSDPIGEGVLENEEFSLEGTCDESRELNPIQPVELDVKIEPISPEDDIPTCSATSTSIIHVFSLDDDSITVPIANHDLPSDSVAAPPPLTSSQAGVTTFDVQMEEAEDSHIAHPIQVDVVEDKIVINPQQVEIVHSDPAVVEARLFRNPMEDVHEKEIAEITEPKEHTNDKALKVRDSNGTVAPGGKAQVPSGSKMSSGKNKRKKLEDELRRTEGPTKKKPRVIPPLPESHLNNKEKSKASDSTKKSKVDGKRRHEGDEEASGPSLKSKQKQSDGPAFKKHRRQSSNSHHDTSSVSPASSSKRRLGESSAPPKLKPKPTETPALDTEICGLLIESMATSRASCLPVSSLYKSVMQCRPSLKAQRSEKEWMVVFERVLLNGEASRGSGVFGKVDSSGKDDSDRPLEAQWFYVPENDLDQERATLIKSMMPRPGKRSETKKYKQYYYRPLEKISRWDPEDEI